MAITPLSQIFTQPSAPSVATPGIVPTTQPTAPRSFPSTQRVPQQQPTATGQGPDQGLATAQQANSIAQSAGQIGEFLSPGITKDILGTGANLSDVTGPLSLASGIQQGNPLAAASGGIKTLGSIARMADVPGMNESLGGLLGLVNIYGGVSSGNIGGAAQGGVTAVKSAIALLQKYPQLADSIGIGQEALKSASGMLGTLTGAGTGGMASGLGNISPQMIVGVLNAAGVGPKDKDWADMWSPTGGLSMLLSGVNPLGMLVAAAADTFSELEQTAKLKSGAYNNPIAGKLYSGATEGVANANKILASMDAAGGPGQIPTESLMKALAPLTNSVLPYFQTGQGGVKAIRASDAAGSPGTQSKDEYTQNFTSAKAGIESIVNELLARGVSYKDIGAIQGVNPGWSSMSLDAGGRPEEYYARRAGEYAKTVPSWNTLVQGLQAPQAPGSKVPQIESRPQGFWQQSGEGSTWIEQPELGPQYVIKPPAIWESGASESGGSFYHLPPEAYYSPWMYAGAGVNGSPIDTSIFTPENAFIAAMGAAGYDPNAMTPEEQSKGKGGVSDVAAMQGVASMYGGPVWMALARMGSSQFAPLIQEQFNPWATWDQMSPEEKIIAMGPTVLGPTQMAKDAGVYAAGGPIANPRVADFFAGLTPAPLPAWVPPTPRTGPSPTTQPTAPVAAAAMSPQQGPRSLSSLFKA